MDDNEFGVPAGWYPDPLGLPQLRWWDNRAWTEHTSEARAPIVIQPGTSSAAAEEDFSSRREDDFSSRREEEFASRREEEFTSRREDGFPSRREQRERERREREESGASFDTSIDRDLDIGDIDDNDLSAQPLLAMTLLELEPPESDTVDDATPGPVAAGTHANTSRPGRRSTFQEEHVGLPKLLVEDVKAPSKKTYTAAVWTIALIPVLQIIASVLLITVLGLGHNLPLLLVVWVSPYIVVLGFAAYDRLVLTTAGHSKPASVAWALLTAPGYLVARAVSTLKETGKGFAPLAVWGGASVALIASVLVIPGIAISVMPAAFSAEAESSVAATAATLGAEITLDCPATPPLVVGEMFTCLAQTPTGETDSIAVSLQRSNGWITWQVEDWGLWVLF